MSEYIEVGQPLQFTDPNTPTRVGEIVENVSDIYNIPSPRLGMQVFVKSEKKSFVITSLKSKVIGGVDVLEAAVEAFEAVGAKSITWNNDNDPSNMNDFTIAGVYDIKGEHTRDDDNLPILNTGGGHTFNARLTVLDSSIPDTTNSDDKCITQVLSFSNRLGQGEVYIRTGKGSSLDNLTWEKWSALQRNVNVGEVGSLDDLKDNGIYSGVWKQGRINPIPLAFVCIVINDYFIGVAPRRISQFVYGLSKSDGSVVYQSRVWDESKGVWSVWEILNYKEIASMISAEIKKVTDGIDPNKIDSLKDIITWIEEHGDVANILAAINSLSEDLGREINARTYADNDTRSKGVLFGYFSNRQTTANEVVIGYKNINQKGEGAFTIPAATTEKAGVMSAEDKLKIGDTSKKTNNIRVVDASSETEEIVICNNDETEEIVKINNEGLTAKKIFNLEGKEIEASGMSVVENDITILEICDEKQCPILTIDSKGNVNTASFNSLNVAKNKFKGKTMLYIGDSISTGNIWHWKGYIKDCIGLNYVNYNTNDTVNVTPAVGGITIRPHNDDDTRPMNGEPAEVGSGAKSIWWRCCNKRLGIYDFDYINLFGGTNDIYDNNLNVGNIDDTPLLDTDVEDLSTLDLSQVSFASAFMGCIEMLQRDFPGKQIFICTLLYNGYARTPDVVKIQMLAAQKYGLIVVPFYYSELNSQNYQWLCDGFHPNQVAARIMEKNFVQYINL